LKNELQKKEDYIKTILSKNKGLNKIQELEYEIEVYREELLRLRSLLTNY
jgi:hypothetical protein